MGGGADLKLQAVYTTGLALTIKAAAVLARTRTAGWYVLLEETVKAAPANVA